jgi:repressor LexA
MQALYPIFFAEPRIPTWHDAHMAGTSGDSGFDRDRVRERMRELKITQTDMARELGVPQSAVSNILLGTRQVKVHEASFIYKRLGLDRQPDVQLVPVIGMTNAGNWREAILSADGVVPMPSGRAGIRAFAVEVKGDSLDEIVQDGEYVVVDPDQVQLYTDKIYLIENENHETQVKVYRSNPARFVPASSNETHQALFIGENPVSVIGRVVWRGGPL